MIDFLPIDYVSEKNANRFWGRVAIKTQLECWLWKGNTHNRYGFFLGRRPSRIVWFLTHGEIPMGLEVLHKCDNPICVNPSHLFLGTHKQNMEDMSKKGRAFPASGEVNGNSKLTQEDVDYIRSRYIPSGGRGKSYVRGNRKSLLDKFKIDPTTLHDIINGVTWTSNETKQI